MFSYDKIPKHNCTFLILALAFCVFMMYHIQHYLLVPISNYTSVEYTLLFLMGCFFLICLLKIKSWLDVLFHYLNDKSKRLDEPDNIVHLHGLTTHELSLFVIDWFSSNGFKHKKTLKMSHDQFCDICMMHDDKLILVCCKPFGDGRHVSQCYIDRLYAKQKKYKADASYFVSITDYTSSSLALAHELNIHLLTSQDMIMHLNQSRLRQQTVSLFT